MRAILWIYNGKCRIMVKDKEGGVIDLNDHWSNVASAQSWLNDLYPEAKQTTIRDSSKHGDLNREWNSCSLGQG